MARRTKNKPRGKATSSRWTDLHALMRTATAWARPRLPELVHAWPAALFFALVGIVWWQLHHADYFRLARLEITPCERVPAEDLREFLHTRLGQRIHSIDLEFVAERVRSHPWVAATVVRRELPNTLIVELTPRRPLALMKADNLYLVDDQGQVFKRLEDGDPTDLPLLTGFSAEVFRRRDAAARQQGAKVVEAIDLLKRCQAMGVIPQDRISEIRWDAVAGFSLVLTDTGLLVRLGDGEFEAKLHHYARVAATLSERLAKARVVDLAVPGRGGGALGSGKERAHEAAECIAHRGLGRRLGEHLRRDRRRKRNRSGSSRPGHPRVGRDQQRRRRRYRSSGRRHPPSVARGRKNGPGALRVRWWWASPMPTSKGSPAKACCPCTGGRSPPRMWSGSSSRSESVMLPKDSEVLHVLPQEYILDNLRGIKHPIGMQGMRLEANCYIVTSQSASVRALLQACRQAGLEIDDVVLKPLASAKAVLDPEEEAMGVALLDMGGGTTDLLVIKDEAVRYASVLPFGAQMVTRDIARCLQLKMPKAEWLKKRVRPCLAVGGDARRGNRSRSHRRRREAFLLEHRELCEIIEARVAEILQLAHAELEQQQLTSLFGRVVLTGGGAHLRGIEELAADVFEVNVRIGQPRHIGGLIDVVSSPSYATAVGLVILGANDFGLSKYARQDRAFFETLGSKLKSGIKKLIH